MFGAIFYFNTPMHGFAVSCMFYVVLNVVIFYLAAVKKNRELSAALGTIIALIDASKYMKNFIKDLVNNLLYNLLKKLNYDEKEKIYLLGYNTEDVEEMFMPISKLCKVDIETEGERDISEVLNKVYEILKNNNGRNFKILFFTSGNLYKQNLSLSKSKLFLYENETQKIRIQVIKYIINEQSIFDKDDENIFDMLNSINSKIKNKSLTIDGKNLFLIILIK